MISGLGKRAGRRAGAGGREVGFRLVFCFASRGGRMSCDFQERVSIAERRRCLL